MCVWFGRGRGGGELEEWGMKNILFGREEK